MTGWVRNNSDGTVEAHFEGDDQAVAQMVEWARRGPSRAEVTDVHAADADPEGRTSFDVR